MRSLGAAGSRMSIIEVQKPNGMQLQKAVIMAHLQMPGEHITTLESNILHLIAACAIRLDEPWHGWGDGV